MSTEIPSSTLSELPHAAALMGINLRRVTALRDELMRLLITFVLGIGS